MSTGWGFAGLAVAVASVALGIWILWEGRHGRN